MSLKLKDITINSNGVKNKISCSSSFMSIPSANDLNLNSTNEVVINTGIDLMLGGNIHNCNRIEGGSSDLNFFMEDYTNSKSIILKTNNVDRITMNNNNITFQNVPSTSTSIVAGSTSSSLISMASFLTNTLTTSPILISSGGGTALYNASNTYSYFTRLANTVFFTIRVTTTDISGLNAGDITVSLPFTSVNDFRYRIGVMIGAITNMNSAGGIADYYAYINPNNNFITITYRNSISSITSETLLTKNELTNTSTMTLSGMYFI